ncbi:MAG: phosphate acyltransferase PlsX [Ruminococcaceae bacterium]|nr:phosphate acyltransferase PlsX [Oscillospiraceae bacterium]
MKIILDVMGGDKEVSEFVRGAVWAKAEYGEEIVLVGDEEKIKEALAAEKAEGQFEIVHAPDVITMEDNPLSIRREHRECSMATALKMVASGKGDAVVSAGNTGALFIGATGYVHCAEGVRRAALASVIPLEKPFLLLDCGANAEVTPEFLVQFAHLGSIYMNRVMGVENPRVGLLNNGAEAHKGTPIYKEAHALLAKESGIHFIGNVEGKDVPFNACDVLVCDGFAGNILLKTIEGTSKFVMKQFSGIFKGVIGKLAGAMVVGKAKNLKKRFDAKEYGGAPFLGIAKPIIKAHGNSDAKAVKNAIRQAVAYVKTGVIAEIEALAKTAE